jgi:beta-galactosidase
MLGWNNSATDVNKHLLLWLSFEDYVNRGKFECYGATPQGSSTMDGIVTAHREYQPESWQAKKSHSPVYVRSLFPEAGIMEVQNRYQFTNLNELKTEWKLLEDGSVIQEGELLLDIQPLKSGQVKVPFVKPEVRSGSDYILLLRFKTRQETKWAPAGYEISFEEFRLSFSNGEIDMLEDKPMDGLTIVESVTEIKISGKDFVYVFDKAAAKLKQVSYYGIGFLSCGPELNVSRPWIVNEISDWGRAEYKEWYEWGLDSLIHETEYVYPEQLSNGEYQIRVWTRSYSFKDRTIQFMNDFIYTFLGSGDLIIDHNVICNVEFPARRAKDDIPWFQKIGLQMDLMPGMTDLTWYGKGPFETYPDRKTGAKTGIYSIPVDEIIIPYNIPEDFGNHTDVRWAAVLHESGKGLAFFSDDLMNVSINPYSNLESAWYPYQLIRKDNITLNIDHRVTGIGGTPITARHAYRTYPGEYHYRIRVKPFDGSQEKLVQFGREKW